MNQAGFSLLELLIVITLISILSLIGNHYYVYLKSKHELSITTKEVINFLYEAKKSADYSNEKVYVYLISPDEFNWCLVLASDENKPNDCLSHEYYKVPFKQVSLNIYHADPMLIFYGRRNTAKAVTIKIKNQIGETQIIISSSRTNEIL